MMYWNWIDRIVPKMLRAMVQLRSMGRNGSKIMVTSGVTSSFAGGEFEKILARVKQMISI